MCTLHIMPFFFNSFLGVVLFSWKNLLVFLLCFVFLAVYIVDVRILVSERKNPKENPNNTNELRNGFDGVGYLTIHTPLDESQFGEDNKPATQQHYRVIYWAGRTDPASARWYGLFYMVNGCGHFGLVHRMNVSYLQQQHHIIFYYKKKSWKERKQRMRGKVFWVGGARPIDNNLPIHTLGWLAKANEAHF